MVAPSGARARATTSNEAAKSILVDAPEPLVFSALTDEKELARWMAKSAKMDAREGGEYELIFHSGARNTETIARGKVVGFVPGRKLACTYVSSEDGPGAPPSLLTWSLEEGPEGKTLVTLVRSGFGGDPYREVLAWGYYLERLAAHCARTAFRG